MPTILTKQEILAKFLEECPDFRSASAIARMDERAFAEKYADDFFGGDEAKAKRAYQEAVAVSQNTALIWANIKDTVAAQHGSNSLFNNIQI